MPFTPGFVARRDVVRAAGALAVIGVAGCSGRARAGGRQDGPGPRIEYNGWLSSRYTGTRMGWTITVPRRVRPRAIVYCLHAKGADHRMAFDSIRVPEVAARLGLPVAVAAVDGGHDSYWHRRADGSDALAMFLCGMADPFCPATRHLTALMRFPHQARFRPGGHDAAYWREAAPWQLRAVGRALRRP